jgi:hypothetical protein
MVGAMKHELPGSALHNLLLKLSAQIYSIAISNAYLVGSAMAHYLITHNQA